MATYADIIAALITRFQTVPGLSRQNTRGQEVGILDYEPQAIQAAPVLYCILERFERSQAGQMTAMRYFVIARLCIKWQDNQAAERQMMPFVNSIPAAIDADQTLGGVLTPGLATLESATAGYTNIAATLHRIVDYRLNILHKAAYRSGI